MTEKFRKKYRIASARAAWWDYGHPGAYFITICTNHRRHYFGEIRQGAMNLSEAGVIAETMWYEIENHTHDIALGSFVVMPNHIHGIIIIEPGDDSGGVSNNGAATMRGLSQDETFPNIDDVTAHRQMADRIDGDRGIFDGGAINPHIFPINHDTTANPGITDISKPGNNPSNIVSFSDQRFRNQGKNTVSSVIGSYKSAVSKYVHRSGVEFAWQRRFWDTIIRDDEAFLCISHYIENNVSKWQYDCFSRK